MAKAKDKDVADSDVPTNVETATGIDTNAESDPLESVDMEEETTMVVDESEEGNKKEETEDNGKDGKDEAEEVKATEDIEADGKGEKPTEDINADDKGESVSNKKAATSSEKTNEAVAEKEVLNEKPNEKLKNTDQPGASAAEKKNIKQADGTGLIFMCNAKTKKDCFNYKVLGLPASKKGLVEKVYKGMRLFLFDIDLKLMYGIYKAASPGGYNLEPKAFKSAFPSQVRFTVLKDCLPLPEEKFKAAIKGNYSGRNKFNCELSAEQVRNLCKLFRTTGIDANGESDPLESVDMEEETSDESEEGDKEDETEDNGKAESVGTDVPEGEKMDEEDKAEEVKATEDIEADEKGENASNKKANKMGKRKRKRNKKKAVVEAATSSEKTNEAAAEKKNIKKADGTGLIFMCNAKTKKDCFTYKVFGLPASKKDLVEKVYKGMRLFLFDIDHKLMFGIYKAASPGGYNLEPKAFKSAFPSQVRFTVLKDCLPLPEEKFKAAFKGNYSGRNKFNCELSAEQVRNLCKLFRTTGIDANGESDPLKSVDMEEETSDESEEGDKKYETEDNVKAELEEVKATEDIEADEKGENASNKKANRKRKRNKKKTVVEAATSSEKTNEAAAEKKNIKKADGTGLIFMCNAKTKKDCFTYKVFGLPASKKDLVEKVYKGMRLFLFDIDHKLMFGIYKAASPGGYNLEPKAFKSAFPSQVRFTVLKDCFPLPEEKFKAALKENYSGRNKFDCELSAEQVANLCKLFSSAGKTSLSKKPREAIRAETGPTGSNQEPRGRPQHERPREDRHGRSRENHVTPRIRGHDLYSRRETYQSPLPRAGALPPLLPPPSYAYERPVDDYYYRIDPLPSLELRRDPLPSIEPRVMDVDPYALYRDPLQYREAGYPLSSLPPPAYAPPYPPRY